MAKFYGEIGYAETVETRPGVWKEKIIPHKHSGDLLKENRLLQPSGQANDDINVSNYISIVADPYAREHYFAMRYVVLHGAKWKITKVDVAYPRLNLTIGGLYNDNNDG